MTMFKILKRFLGVLLVFPCFFLTLSASSSFGGDFSLGPLFNIDHDEGENSKEINALGPFITYKKSDTSSEFGLRPLFYWVKDKEADFTGLDFLYPFSTYGRSYEDWRAQSFFYLLSYRSTEVQDGFRDREFTLFPLIFSKSAREEGDSYFALFPIYGRLKNRFFRDEINFFLFPLFLQTRKGEDTNNSVLWPFFGYYTGNQEGFRAWPLYGYRKKEDVLDEKFILWPIYVSKERVFYGERMRYFSVFPFYSDFDSPQREHNTYLWPLFSHQVDKKRGIERWDTPWPLINFTRGTERENRVFPFYAREIDDGDKEGFYLWPIYKYNTATYEDYRRDRERVLFYLYSDVEENPIIEGGRSGRRIDVWPLFSYRRDREGNRSFHLLSLLEPFLSGNEGIERNYSPFWRLYEWEKDKDGKTTASFLWNTYRRESGDKGTRVHLKPIIPLFSYVGVGKESSVDFLGGLFGYRSDSYEKTVKLFFIPIDFSSDDKAMEEVRRDE